MDKVIKFLNWPTVSALIGFVIVALTAEKINLSEPIAAGVMTFSMIYADLAIKRAKRKD